MKAPVCIGGLGGSGTGMVAEILIKLGFFLGKDLVGNYDCREFNQLLIRPDWYRKQIESDDFSETVNALEVFSKRMLQHEAYAWGWKEPNSHIFINHLADFFSGLKYILVLRHGLDMVFSINQRQLASWGWFFDVASDAHDGALEYWIKANMRAIDLGKMLLGDRFLVVHYEHFCKFPILAVNRLIEFLGIDISDEQRSIAYSIPFDNPTINRYKKYDLDVFNQWTEDVQMFGYTI
jgi:hypothetical protein